MNDVLFVPLVEIAALRGERDCALQLDGLWVRGSLEALRAPCVAIVGTRAATPYGRRIARLFSRELSAAGCCVISGLAAGIDACAHEGALEANAPTIGVLGSGHERFFPPRNRELGSRMVSSGGAVLSPFPPDQPAWPSQFLQRNGVVAALSDAVVVIEAPARSGALNTAGWAADRIPVFAVPGDVDRAHVAGCHTLIRDGAILARCTADVLEVLRLPAQASAVEAIDDDGLHGRLLRALQGGESDLETLSAAVAAPPAQILAGLALLELEGLVERNGTRFARTRAASLLS